MIKEFFLIFLVIGISLILNIFNIRLCPFFYLFRIPCIGCGMTRALRLILELKFIESFKYNILPIPLILLSLYYIYDKEKLNIFFNENKKIIILLCTIIAIITWIINLYNTLLY